MQSLGEKFKQRLLAEARTRKAKATEKPDPVDSTEVEDPAIVAARSKYEKQMGDLLEAFPTKQSKAVLTLMVTLGAPIRGLMLHKSELRKTMDSASDLYLKNSSFRMWAKKFLEAVAAKEGVAESVKEDDAMFEKHLSGKYQHIIYDILEKLGLPSSVVATANRALLTGIRAKAKLALADSDVRVYLMALANVLDVDTTAHSDEDEEVEGKKLGEAVLIEDAAPAIAAVEEFLTACGFDTQGSRSIKMQLNQQHVKSAMMKLASAKMILTRLGVVTKQIEAKTRLAGAEPSTTNPPSKAAPQMAGFVRAGSLVAEAEKKTKDSWIMAEMGKSGYLLKKDGLTIKLDSGEADKLEYALNNHKTASVMSGDKRFEFRFDKKAKSFSVYDLVDKPKFPEGLLLSSEDVAGILSLIANETAN
jgi:hypothetical protein